MTFVNLGYKIHYTRGDDLVAAAELPLNGTGDYFHVSGTTTITSLATLETGMQVLLYFTEALTIEHSANLVLPNGDNLDIDAGDTTLFRCESPGVWRLIGGNYHEHGGGGSAIHGSDKTVADIGSPLVSNGDFFADLSQWTTDWSWSPDYGGSADGTGATTLQQSFPVVEGDVAYGEMEIADRTTGYITVQVGDYFVPYDEDNFNFAENGVFTASLKAYGTGNTDVIVTTGGGFDGKLKYLKIWTLSPATPAVTITDENDIEAAHILIDDTNDNHFFGQNSGFYTYSSSDNVAYGKNAGESLVSGSNNVFIGKDTGEDCTMGSYNVAIGANSFEVSVIGSSNTLIGHNTGALMEEAFRNVCIGRDAGSSLTDGVDNIIVGPHAGTGITTNNGGILIGSYSGSTAATLNDTILIGNSSGRELTQATDSIVLGTAALYYATNASRVVAIGTEALENNSTGTDNIAIGFHAGENITSGNHGIFIGSNAGRDITTSGDNVCVGHEAGRDADGMTSSVLIGYQAGREHQGGDNNVGIGYQTLFNVETGSRNSVVGYQSGASITTGEDNTAVGYDALASCLSGEDNTAVGSGAGAYFLDTDRNVCVGKDAGARDAGGFTLQNNSNSIFIGAGSRSNADGSTNEIVIGDAVVGNGSNTTTIGNSSCILTELNGLIYAPTGQIEFPVTPNPSTNAYTLDDYREGTWTPELQFGGATTGITYQYQLGSYTKIGRQVVAHASLKLTSTGTATGVVTIDNLPFTALSEGGMRWVANVVVGSVTHTGDDIVGWIVGADDEIALRSYSSATGVFTSLLNSDFTNSSTVFLTITYMAT